MNGSCGLIEGYQVLMMLQGPRKPDQILTSHHDQQMNHFTPHPPIIPPARSTTERVVLIGRN